MADKGSPAAAKTSENPHVVPRNVHLFWMFSFLVLEVAAISWVSWPTADNVGYSCVDNASSPSCSLLRAQQVTYIFSVVAVICGGLALAITAISGGADDGILPAGLKMPAWLTRQVCIAFWIAAALAGCVAAACWPGNFGRKHNYALFTDSIWLGLQISSSILAWVSLFSYAKDYRVWLIPSFMGLALCLQIALLSNTFWPLTEKTKHSCDTGNIHYDSYNCRINRAAITSETFGTASAIVGGVAFFWSFVSALASSGLIPESFTLCRFRAVTTILNVVTCLFAMTAVVVLGGSLWHNDHRALILDASSGMVMYFNWLALQIAVAAITFLACFFVIPYNNWRNYLIPIAILAFAALQISAVAMNNWPKNSQVKDVCDAYGKSDPHCALMRSMSTTEAFSASAAILSGFAFILALITALAKDEVTSSGNLSTVTFIISAIMFLFSLTATIVYPATSQFYIFDTRLPSYSFGYVTVTPVVDMWLRLQIAATAAGYASLFFFLPNTDVRKFLVAALWSAFFAVQVAALCQTHWPKPKDVTQHAVYCSGHPSADSCKLARATQASETMGIIAVIVGGVAWILSIVGTLVELPDMLFVILGAFTAICALLASVVWPGVYKMHYKHLGLSTQFINIIEFGRPMRYTWLQLQIAATAASAAAAFFAIQVKSWRQHVLTVCCTIFFTMQAASLSALANEWPWPRSVTHKCAHLHIYGEFNDTCIILRATQAVETFGIISAIFGGFAMIWAAIGSKISGLRYTSFVLAILGACSSLLASVIGGAYNFRLYFTDTDKSNENSVAAQLQAIASIFGALSVVLAALNTWSAGWVQPTATEGKREVQMS